MSLPSLLRYRDFILRTNSGRLRDGDFLRLNIHGKCSGDIWLREIGSDHGTYWEIFLEEVYQEVTSLVKDCEYIVDLGANIGLASRYFAGHYPMSSIFSVEPDNNNYRSLERNLSILIGSGRCRTLRGAAWGSTTGVSIELLGGDPSKHDCFYTQEITRSDGDAMTTQITDAFSVEDIIKLSGFHNIDLLKIDIEGAEVRLFCVDTGWLDRVGAIAIEFHGNSRKDSGFDKSMKYHNFKLHNSNNHTVMAVK